MDQQTGHGDEFLEYRKQVDYGETSVTRGNWRRPNPAP